MSVVIDVVVERKGTEVRKVGVEYSGSGDWRNIGDTLQRYPVRERVCISRAHRHGRLPSVT